MEWDDDTPLQRYRDEDNRPLRSRERREEFEDRIFYAALHDVYGVDSPVYTIPDTQSSQRAAAEPAFEADTEEVQRHLDVPVQETEDEVAAAIRSITDCSTPVRAQARFPIYPDDGWLSPSSELRLINPNELFTESETEDAAAAIEQQKSPLLLEMPTEAEIARL